jgi:hypothetical protein
LLILAVRLTACDDAKISQGAILCKFFKEKIKNLHSVQFLGKIVE